MPLRGLTIAAFFLLVAFLAQAQSVATPADDQATSKDTAYIKQAESDWAESTATNDVAVLSVFSPTTSSASTSTGATIRRPMRSGTTAPSQPNLC